MIYILIRYDKFKKIITVFEMMRERDMIYSENFLSRLILITTLWHHGSNT